MQAVLDADFINKIDEIKSTDTKQLFRKLMKELNCTPVVHPYVMSHELFSCNLAQDMIEEGLLRSVDYKEFLPDDKREGYEQRFRDLLRRAGRASKHTIISLYGTLDAATVKCTRYLWRQN